MPEALRPIMTLPASALDGSGIRQTLIDLLETHQTQICLAMPATQLKMAEKTAAILMARAGIAAAIVLVKDDVKQGPALILNKLFDLSPATLFGYVAQDVFPGRQWLHRAVAVMKQAKAGVVAFNDGKWAGQIASYGLVQASWVRKVYANGLFYPGYRQHFGDVELSLIAQQHKAYGYDPHAVLLEIDSEKDSKSVDLHDRHLFASRKLNGFDGRVTDITLLGRFG